MRALSVLGASVWRDGAWQPQDLACRDGRLVAEVGADPSVVDAAGLLAAPGFIDLQCNGALGIDLASEPERMWELAAGLPRWGVTAWLPTIVTAPAGVVERALAALSVGPPPGWVGAMPLGLHLEGPFLAPVKRGAHREPLLQAPSLAAIDGWSRDAGVTVVTLAPELEGAREVIAALVARGVIVSLGHSAATAAEARAGVDAGATWVTHLFNAMSPLHHRDPGLAGVALSDERLRVGLIADGIHVDPAVVAMAERALGDRLTLVTDAVGALGLPEGSRSLGGRSVTIGRDGVRLADGTLAGASVSLDHAVRNLVEFSRCRPATALAAASAAPAALLGDAGRGTLACGACADVVLLTESLDVVMTIVGGEVVHDARS